MNRTILKPQVDVPLVVQLDRADGKETTNQRGELEYQYTLNNDQAIMWLPAAARAQLLRIGAQAGDTVQLVKSLRGKNAFWNAQVLADSAEPAPPPPPPTTRMMAPRPAYANGAPQAGAAQHQPLPPSNGYAEAMSKPIAQPAAAQREVQSLEELMTLCLTISANANWQAFKAAQYTGCEIEGPTWEDVRAAGISLFIERMRNGGGR